jgi:hypothetical protein
MIASVLRANEVFAGLEGFDPVDLIEAMGDAETLLAVGEALGLFDVLPIEQADALRAFLGDVPASLDAAAVAGLRSALGRGLRTQLTWQPGYAFELRAWEVTEESGEEWAGLVNLHLVTPEPVEPPLA